MTGERLERSEQAHSHQECKGGCKTCQALARLATENTPEPRYYVLGALWVFILPMMGLIVGTAVAAQWEQHPWRQVLAIVGGLAIGIAVGVAGRKATFREPLGCPQVEGNLKE